MRAMTSPALTIAAVERETRLSKDVLRVWEKRYGFPTPARDANGERCYPVAQVERLRLMKRLMDQGLRPGRLVGLSDAQLAQLAQRPVATAPAHAGGESAVVGELLAALKRDPQGFRQAMRQHLARLGLERFVGEVAAPLTAAVGSRWEEGSLDIFDEHFYTETATRVLRHALGTLPETGAAPRILLTTLPGETHGLGLIMVEALLALDGASCIALGTETPPASIARACQTHGADVLALSFSTAYPRRQVAPALQQLRQALPEAIAIWAGGAGAAGAGAIHGVQVLSTLEGGRQALADWRAGRPSRATPPQRVP
jgi:DNA-binding transcriptional MerR regulator/methylmalonyl-CoA mutase cobalamin-binding subunit